MDGLVFLGGGEGGGLRVILEGTEGVLEYFAESYKGAWQACKRLKDTLDRFGNRH